MCISNGFLNKSFGKYINSKELYHISSDITVDSKKYYYCKSHKDCSICKAFSYLTAICKLGRHSALKKKPKMKEF